VGKGFEGQYFAAVTMFNGYIRINMVLGNDTGSDSLN
jgi:hypothetical protein